MASNSFKIPPSPLNCKANGNWLKVKVWKRFTDLPANRHGSALVLFLEEKKLEVLEIDD